jgi:protein associated with RNAse G/E
VERHFKSGEHCVLRGIVNNQVWIVQSMIVVQDNDKESVLLLLPGSQCAFPKEYREWRDTGRKKHINRWQVAKKNPLILEEFIWQRNRILFFIEPEKFYSICMFWHHESDAFNCYYVNFQLPYKRSRLGFETLDLDLDIVIDENYEWKWKDVDEYQAGIREGGIKDDWVRGIEQSKEEVLGIITKRSSPLDGSWLQWRPDPTWELPKLPKGWEKI